MRLEQSFEVPVPVAQAWGVLLDLERVAPCMPGATLTSFDGTEFTGNVKVKLGPVSLAYKGNGRFVERDEDGRRLSFVASGQDSRGAGGASARVTAVLHESGASTVVKVVADLDIAGRAAQFGRGMIADVTGKLVKQFADCLAQTIAASAAPAPAPVEAAPAPAPVEAAPAPTPVEAAPAPVEPAPAPAPVEAAAPVLPPPPVVPPVEPAPAPAPAPAVAAAATPPAAAPAPAEPVAPVAETEYHPMALQEPEGGAAAPPAPPPAQPPAPEPEPVPQPESAYAYSPEPPVAETPAPTPLPPPTPTPAPAPPREAEPVDLLAVAGPSVAKRVVPVLVVLLVIIGVVVYLLVR